MGVLNASIRVTGDWAEGHPTPFAWPLLMELTATYTFFLLLPLMVRFDRRFPAGRESWPVRLPLHLGFSVVVGVTHTLMMWGSRSLLVPLLGRGSFDYGLMRHRFLMEYQKQALAYVLVYAIVVFVDYQRRDRERELRAAELWGQLVEARMDALKMQLNPHFLFNTLNTISSHVRAEPERADTMLSLLSDFLIVVEDDGPGLEGDTASAFGRGLGLTNTRERLRTLYGETQRLTLESPSNGGLRVTLEVPWREAGERR